MNKLIDTVAIEVPFNLSFEETELVKMPMSSIFILGRSGTGKTTVLIFRMLGIQQVSYLLFPTSNLFKPF
jgi:ABC-type Fe3+/spermidine/putrescine transport system ATPase subunit